MILSMKHGRIFPMPPHFSCYNISPEREIINRWERWERFPVRAARYFGSQASTALVPRLKSRRQASAWLSQSPSRTGKTWQKSPLPVTFIPALPAVYSHPSTSLDTQTEEPGFIFRTTLSVRIKHAALVLQGLFWGKNISDWVLELFERSCAHSWITLDSSRFSQALGPGPFHSNLQANTDD